MNLREVQLSEPVHRWLVSKGLTPYAEFPIPYHTADWLAVKKDHLIVVEMKICLSREVIHRARLEQSFVDQVWVAVLSNPRISGIGRCEDLGIGVLTLREDRMVEIAPASNSRKVSDHYRNKILSKLEGREPGGVAGMPTLRGDGPAIRCLEAVDRYREKHPEATWKEIYKEVPNHYASPKSLANSMGKVRGRLESREEDSVKGKIKIKCVYCGRTETLSPKQLAGANPPMCDHCGMPMEIKEVHA